MIGARTRRRTPSTLHATHARRPLVEGLEGRLLLYATTGGQWTKPARITYSFVPDGTLIGGVPSNLQSVFNARFGATAWKKEFAKAAAVWQKQAKINFTLVTDDGSSIGVAGNQQSDGRFGDIRIGGFVMPDSQLAFAYLPPPFNGGTNAGDIFFNTNQAWQINGTAYDLMTVAIHEFGHSLGLHHSTDTSATMWPAYTGTKQAVVTDDIGGIRQIYNSRQNDYFDLVSPNNTASSSANITSYLDASGRLTLSALDSTTPMTIAQSELDWFAIIVPPTTNGTMTVRMQSAGLSLLSPHVAVYNSAGTTRLGFQESLEHGDTVSVTITGVLPGQVYKILTKGTTTGNSGYGGYGLQISFGATAAAAITIPNTIVGMMADQGGGTLGQDSDGHEEEAIESPITKLGDPGHFWSYDDWDTEGVPETESATLDTSGLAGGDDSAGMVAVGGLSGLGHSFSVHGYAEGHGALDLTPRGWLSRLNASLSTTARAAREQMQAKTVLVVPPPDPLALEWATKDARRRVVRPINGDSRSGP
jgi:hypothetical protein